MIMNDVLLYLYFFIGLLFSAIFYTIGSYFFRYAEKLNIKFQYIFLISIILGMIAYAIKVTIFYFYGKKFTIMFINILYLVATFFLVTLYSKIILNEDIKIHTYIIFTIIILLIILDHFMHY